MNKVAIYVDLDNNSMFEETVKEAIKGQARRSARSAVDKEVSSEVERIVEKVRADLLRESSYGLSYSGELYRKIYNLVLNMINKDTTELRTIMNKAVSDKIENLNEDIICKVLDKKLADFKKDIETRVREIMREELARIIVESSNSSNQ